MYILFIGFKNIYFSFFLGPMGPWFCLREPVRPALLARKNLGLHVPQVKKRSLMRYFANAHAVVGEGLGALFSYYLQFFSLLFF